jgi:Sulfotransferase family
MDAGPIFIGGLSYSGKTELRLMLSSHPNIAITRRTYMWPRYYGRYGDLGRPAQLERCLEAMLRNKHIRALSPDLERIRREFRQGEPTYGRLFALFQAHFAERMGRARWGDQLGFVEQYVEPIFAAYPAATMIHMVRDPRERYAEAVPRARRRRGKLGWDTARWLHSVRLAQRSRRRYPERYRVLRYESLVSNPEAALRELCALIGEPFVPAMLTAQGAIRFGGEAQAAQPAPALAHSAPEALSAGEIAFTQLHAGRAMRAYGYAPAPTRLTHGERLRLYAVDWPANLAAMLAWRTLETTPLARH